MDLYSQPRDLGRPLTPEQVKDAGVLLLDLISAHEAELLIEQERQNGNPEPLPSYGEIAAMFAERYRRENAIGGTLTEDDWNKATDVFLSYISSC